MNSIINIRPYEVRDKQACVEAFVSNIPKYFTKQEVLDFEAFLDRIIQPHVKGFTHYFVIEQDTQLVGCGGYGDKEGTQHLSLAWGLVHNAFHKQGFGLALLQHRLQHAQLHYSNLPLVLDTTQHSFGFFEKFGFRVTKITEHFYEPGMHRYDMVLK